MIPLSLLNDFCFCPYSVYLHSIYTDADGSLFQAAPQLLGSEAHRTVDENLLQQEGTVTSLPVCSTEYGIHGVIDILDTARHVLVERKYRCPSMFPGQRYQLWGQLVCLREMGFTVTGLEIHEMSTRRTIPVACPTSDDLEMLKRHIENIRSWSPEKQCSISAQKCAHCIYSALCDRTDIDNVYDIRAGMPLPSGWG